MYDHLFYFRWYFGPISQREAEDLLRAETNNRGTFLVRESEHIPGGLVLSIRYGILFYHIFHYNIKPLDNNRGYFIDSRRTFTTLNDLVVGYQRTNQRGIICQLTKPCQKPQHFNIQRSQPETPLFINIPDQNHQYSPPPPQNSPRDTSEEEGEGPI